MSAMILYVIHAVIFAGIAFMENMVNQYSVRKISLILEMASDIVMSLNADYMSLNHLM